MRPRTSQGFIRLLLSGGLLGPIAFTAVYLVEGATRPGYDPLRDAVSALSLTDRGWVDAMSLVVNGALLMACALGVRRSFVSREIGWTPFFLALSGLGFIAAGVFATDPAQGYPPGTPPGPATATTLHGTLHFAIGATLAFGGLILASLAFGRRFGSDNEWRGWGPYSVLTALATAVCFVGFAYAASHAGPAGLLERIALTIALAWVAALVLTLHRRVGRPPA